MRGGHADRRRPGIEGEAELPYATLADIATPLLGPLDAIPPPQAAALRGALALAPPSPGDRFAVAVGLLSLLAAATGACPVLVVVDDLPWVAPASAEAVPFTARRLSSERAALITALRDDGPHHPPPDGVAALRVGPLAAGPAADLLAARAAPPVPPLMDRVVRRTALEGALAALGLTPDDLAPAEERGVLSHDDGGTRWRHPLMRSAVHAATPGRERRAAHEAVAAVVTGPARAWHLAAARTAPDDEAADALDAAGP